MVWLTKKIDSSKKPGKSGKMQRRGEMINRKFHPIVELLEERTLLSAAVQVTNFNDTFWFQGIYDIDITIGTTTDRFGVGLLPISLNHVGDPPSSAPQFESLCVDALDSLDVGTTTFPATPTAITDPLHGVNNGGEIAYLYNHYGYFPISNTSPFTYANPPGATTPADIISNSYPNSTAYPLSEAVGLQLAVWELEYGAQLTNVSMVDEYDTTTGGPDGIVDNLNPPGPFDPATATAFAAKFVNEAQMLTPSQNETATFLDVSADNPKVYPKRQGLLAPTPTPTIVTTASFSAGNVVGSAIPQDSAMISGGYSETGSLVFTLKAPDNSIVDTETVAISGDGTYGTSNATVATQVGTYTWTVSYAGDSLNNGAVDNGVNESVTTIKASPSISTSASETASGVVGTAMLSDSVTVSGGDNPTGTVTFTVTAPDGTVLPGGTATINGAGPYSSSSVLATQVGTYTWHASYGGDSLNNGAVDNGDNESVTTIKASPSISTSASETASGVVGTAMLTDSVTVSGGDNPTGTVTFTVTAPDGTVLPGGTATINGAGPYSSSSVLATQVGTYTWHASYGGDSLNNGAVDNGVNESVTTIKASPSISTSASETASGVVGTAMLTDSVTVSGGDNPTGTVTFTVTAPDGTVLPGGTATINGAGPYSSSSVLATQVGTYTWHASYGGDSLNNGAVDNGVNESVTTIKASPSISTSASETASGVVGTAMLSDSVTVSGGDNPTGTVTFTVTAPDGTVLPGGTATINGAGPYSSSSVLATQVGTYTWHASYGGDSLNNGAVDNGVNESVTTIKASPSISTSASETASGVVGTAMLSDSVTVSGGDNPTGTVTFTVTAPDGTVLPGGTATINGAGPYSSSSVLATQVGTYTWHASYGGDSLNNGAVDNGVNESVTTIKATPKVVTAAYFSGDNAAGDALPQDSAVLSGGYHLTGGTLTFTLKNPDGTTLDTEVVTVTGDNTYHTSNTHVATQMGTYTWTVTYSGDGLNNTVNDQGGTAEQLTTLKTDLSVLKTDGSPYYTPGANDTYTITVTNNGPSTVTGAVVTDPIPAGTTFVSATGGATYNSVTKIVSYTTGTLGTLPSNNSASFMVTIAIPASFGSTTNSADFTTLGANNTPLAQNVTVNGIRADAYYVTGSATYNTANTTLYLRNEPNDHGLGIVSNGEVASQGGDVNEISNQLNLDVLRLTKAAGDTWTSLWVSSLDSGGSGGKEMGTLYWSNSANPDLSTLTGFTFKFGDFGTSVEGDLLTLHPAGFDPTANYLFFRAGPNPCGNNNDYLFWKATTTTPGMLCNTATVTPPAGVVDINPNNNSSQDCDTPLKATPGIATVASLSSGGYCGSSQTSDKLIVSGGNNPTGTVTFTLTLPDGTTSTIGTVTISGDGTYTGPTVPVTEVGTYTWHATYGGDSLNSGAIDNGQNESVTTGKATPTIVTVASCGGVVNVVTLTDTATLSGGYGVNGGTITFTLTAPNGTKQTEVVTVTNGDNNYPTPVPILATQIGTYTWSATYSGNATNNSATDNGKNETTVVTATPIVIKGTKYSDVTGNGFSADDTGLGGVTIALYKESNNCAGLQTGSSGDYLVGTTTTASDGTYSFSTGLVAGVTYYVVEVVPSNTVQTGGGPNGSAGCTYYTICAQTGKTYSGNDFDDYQKGTCAPTNVCFLVGGCTTVHDLRGNTQQGQTVTVTFTTTMTEQLTLVSYTAPGSSYSQSTAYLQQIFDQATGTFAPGVHTLTVQIPNGFYQVDFVCGAAINPLAPQNYGPDFSNILYSAQGRLISADNGGCAPNATPNIKANDFATVGFWNGTKGQSLINALNGGGNKTYNLGNWLASNFPHLFGSLANQNDSVVASFYTNLLGVNSTLASQALAQVMAAALGAYATDQTLAGNNNAHTWYNFNTSNPNGVGLDSFDTSTYGAVLGLTGANTKQTILELLYLTDQLAININPNNIPSATVNAITAIFSGINNAGGIH